MSADYLHIDGLVDVPVPAARERRVQELHLWNLHSFPKVPVSVHNVAPLCR